MSGQTSITLNATPNTSGGYDTFIGTYYTLANADITSDLGPDEVEFATFDTSSVDQATLAAIENGQLAITLNFTTSTTDAIPHTIDILGSWLTSDQQDLVEAEHTNRSQVTAITKVLLNGGQNVSDYGGITVAAAVPPFSSGTNQNTAQTLDVTQAFLAAAQAGQDFFVSFREATGGISNVTGLSLSGSYNAQSTVTALTGAETGQIDAKSAPIRPFVTLAVNGGSNGTVTTDTGNDGTTTVTTSQVVANTSLVITINQPANGTLSGAGLTGSSGTYTLAAAMPSTLTALLEQLVFTPSTTGPLQSNVTTTFTVTDDLPLGGGLSGSLPVGSATVSVIQPTAPIVKVAANLVVRDQAPTQVFANNEVSDNGGPTVSAVIKDASLGYDGTLSGAGLTETTPGAYALAATTPAALAAELAALVFTPQSGLAPPLTPVTDSLTVTVTDPTTTLSTSATVNYTFTVQQSLVLSGVTPALSGTDTAAVAPFATVVVTDPYAQPLVNAQLQVTSGSGTLSGPGLTTVTSGNYTLAPTSVAALTSELQALQFTPAPGQSAIGTTSADTIALTVIDAADLLSAEAATTVTVTAEPIAPKLTGVTGTIIHGSSTGGAEAALAAATVSDSEYQPTDFAVLTLQNDAGQDTDANGTLSGPGLASSPTACTTWAPDSRTARPP